MKLKNTRDHLANERTFLAWVRTSTALIALGIVIIKFFRSYGGSTLGTIVIVLGVALIPYAGILYKKVQVAIEKGYPIVKTKEVIIVSIIFITIALFSFVAIYSKIL